ncbi:MAG: glycoside hydrolase domain-containing protein [Gemmatimonadota bacterium]
MRRIIAAGALLVTGACASVPAVAPEAVRGVPGFDTRDYPGDAALRTWFAASPYRWVGYYLAAPCHTGTTWTGRRAPLRDMGWGFGVLFVGEQDWAPGAGAADTTRAAAGEPRCTRTNLTAERGTADAAAAAGAAAAEGFPPGTVIFLDVERVENVSPGLAAYVRAWAGGLLDGGRYVPGLYSHDTNAEELITVLTEEFLRRQRVEQPRLWVARQAGFDIDSAPTGSGHPAAVWQGVFDRLEAWGGMVLPIDVNVADSPDPSRGR